MKDVTAVEYHATIHDLPSGERPRERLRDHGANNLSNTELLAIILRTGTATENAIGLASHLLRHFGGLGGLVKANFSELCAIHGLGEAKAAQLKAALELGKRLTSFQGQERVVVSSPRDVANLLAAEMNYLEQEHLRVVLMNTKNEVTSIREVYKGSINTAVVRVGEVFREAIRQNCASLIVVHNHPSGDCNPSQDDIRVTEQVVAAGKLLDIEVLDHLIIAERGFTSFKERGLVFK